MIDTTATAILVDELSAVTPAMLDAGSRAEYDLKVEDMGGGKRRLRPTSAAERLAAIWRAMLLAKLSEPAAPKRLVGGDRVAP